MILIISFLSGAVAVLVCHAAFSFVAVLQVEKRLNERIEGARLIRLRGISGNALFLSEKIGNFISAYKAQRIERYAAKLSSALTMLGGAYATVAPHTFMGVQVISGCAGMAIGALLLNTLNIAVLAAIGTGTALLPFVLLQQKVKERHRAIFRQIPDVLDLLSLMIEAGLDFSAALQRVTAHEKGPLIQALASAQQEIRLGKSRTDALNDLAERTASLPLRTMVNAFTLAFATGASITPTLKSLSEQFRVERAQQAEKLAQEAPVKLLIPLVIFIFPTIFIILFGPILLSFLGN